MSRIALLPHPPATRRVRVPPGTGGELEALTTLASCVMATSKCTVTGSETFSTGLMNWLY